MRPWAGFRPIIGERMPNLPSVRRVLAPRCWLIGALAAVTAVGCGGSTANGDDGVDAGVPEVPPSTPMRHLNRVELFNTLKDLLGPAFTGDWNEVLHRLPPDARVGGLDTIAQAIGTSAPYVEQMGAVLEFVVGQTDLAQVAPGAADATALPALFDRLGRRALRRPLTADERTSYTALYDHLAPLQGHEVGVRAVLQRLLQSPDFLYQIGLGDAATGKLTDHEMASRLSYLLWESMPDDALAAAADRGEMHTPAQVEAALARLAADPRAAQMLERFEKAWLQIDRLATIVKNPFAYPEFIRMQPSMQESLDRFLADNVATGDLTELLTSDEAYVDDNLAELYGVASPGAMARVPLQASQRGGIMTQAAFLSVFGKADRSSPILRGVFVLDRLLCQPPDPPPPGAGVIPPDLPSPTTTRDFFADLTAAPGCATCHDVINPIGFGFEHFDGIGRWRIEERGFTIDATGHATVDGALVSYDGAEQLADTLAHSAQVRRCLVRRWFGSRFGRFDAPLDAPIVDALDGGFAASGTKLRSLATVLARTDAFYRPHFELPRP